MKHIVFIIILLLASSESFALVGVEAVGGLSIASQTASPTTMTGSSANFLSYGLMGNVHFPSRLGLTFGALYTEMGSHIKLGSSAQDEKVPYFQVPVIIDFWFGGIFALGVGGYYGFPGGNVVDSNSTGTFANSSQTFSQAGYTSNDYGVVGHAALHIPLGPKWFVAAEGLYEYGIQNVSSTPGLTLKNSTILALGGVGVKF